MQCYTPVFLHAEQRVVPCGHCNFCLQNKRLDWAFRLLQEQQRSESSHFLTLTYSDEYVRIDPATGSTTVSKEDLRNFLKRLRKDDGQFKDASRKPIRYYAVGEYGGTTARAHYHAILFNCSKEAIGRLHKTWKLGHHHLAPVNAAVVGYVTGYTISEELLARTVARPFAAMSKRPGIGNGYVRANAEWHRDEAERFNTDVIPDHRFYVMDNGHKRRMPRYFRDKIFTREEVQENEYFSAKNQEKMYEAFLERTRKFQKNPEDYYHQSIKWQHDSIKLKVKSKRKQL